MQTTYSVNESKRVLKVKVISLPCFFSRFCMFCAFPRPRYQVSVYRTNDPLILSMLHGQKLLYIYMSLSNRRKLSCYPCDVYLKAVIQT